MIITICMVKGIRDQKPLPPWMAKSTGLSPAATPIRKTTTIPTSANTRGSGNQRSLQLEARRRCAPGGLRIKSPRVMLRPRPGTTSKPSATRIKMLVTGVKMRVMCPCLASLRGTRCRRRECVFFRRPIPRPRFLRTSKSKTGVQEPMPVFDRARRVFGVAQAVTGAVSVLRVLPAWLRWAALGCANCRPRRHRCESSSCRQKCSAAADPNAPRWPRSRPD